MSTPLDEAGVRRLARLARLALSDAEVREFQPQLAAFLEYVRVLESIDTTGVEPLYHPLPIQNVLRDDVPRDGLTSEAALATAPQREGDYFRVPAVLDGGSGA